MQSTKTFNFIRKIISILSVCTDEIIEVTSNYQTNNNSPGITEPIVSVIPPIDLSAVNDQQLTARTVYTKPIDLSKI